MDRPSRTTTEAGEIGQHMGITGSCTTEENDESLSPEIGFENPRHRLHYETPRSELTLHASTPSSVLWCSTAVYVTVSGP